MRHWGQIALHTFSSSDNWKGGAADLKHQLYSLKTGYMQITWPVGQALCPG